MNKIDKLFQHKKNSILSIFYTAGYPNLEDTTSILLQLQNSGVDMVEVGFPFSDPLADGPVIQHSGQVALDNGMTLQKVFEQLKAVQNQVEIPIVLMGYINPVLRMGIDEFLSNCKECGVSGVILPDVPLELWERDWSKKFDDYGIYPILLITPQTSDARVRRIDALSKGFVYLVASSGTTGRKHEASEATMMYFNRIKQLGLKNPVVAGFGIHDRASFTYACEHADGAIIGSAFVNFLKDNSIEEIPSFIQSIR
ncbi:MAG TPA: tryptophan synthase subunit alpha [Flavobacteriales bacterium]